MVQALIEIDDKTNRVLNIVKAQHNLKDKSQAIGLVVGEYEEAFLEPELRPDYVEKLKRIRKEKGIKFKNVAELRRLIENAKV